MVESPKLSSHDSDQYHGKGWQPKKAKGSSQSVSMLRTNDATHAAALEQQAIWRTTADPEVAEQETNSEQSSNTVYAEEAPVTSRSDH